MCDSCERVFQTGLFGLTHTADLMAEWCHASIHWKVQNSLSFVNERVNWASECVNWMDGRVNEWTDGWINKWELCLCVSLHTHILRDSYFMSSSAFYPSYSNICCYLVSLVYFHNSVILSSWLACACVSQTNDPGELTHSLSDVMVSAGSSRSVQD